jgi:hypothetical protein
MNRQDLLSNLQGQSYQNGYVVNNDKPSFVNLNASIRLGNSIPQPFFKSSNNINQLYFKEPSQVNVMNSQTAEPTQINVSEGNFDTSVVYKEFIEARRVNLQIQNRQNERLVNQINTMYAPTASTKSELEALRTTRPMLEDGLDAIEEYSKTHFLTPAEKQKLREDLIKTNYAKWKANVDGVKDGTIGGDEEQFLTDLPNVPNPSQSVEDERLKDIAIYGDLVNTKVNVQPTDIRRMAETYLIPFEKGEVKGDFYSYLKDSKSPPVSYLTMSRFLSFLINDRNLLEERISIIIKQFKIPDYLKNIIQIINIQVKEKTGDTFINVNAEGLRNIVNTDSLQYKKLLDIMFELFKEIRRQIPIKNGDRNVILLAIADKSIGYGNNKLNIKTDDLYIESTNLKIYKKEYVSLYNQKNNPVIENIIVDEDEPTGGAAAGGSGGSQPTPARLPPANTLVEDETPTLADPSSELKEKPQSSRVKKRALKAKRK